eukprot:CAMPEP_0117761534 /NCGR_PEP_ID=MMETSP0947-20121206/17345_1 /TAXON_ID=44440 /ORGANISM="Chattonella subsalsa, Strain CCMP2191" /LENGTH=818 /DNA_ID=CAMNT_0005582559 /DNA_START=174 /DNA_END=2630 /DNA_ORIENTATION=-
MAQSKDGVPKEAKEFASCMGTAHAITGAWGFLEKGVQFGPVELDTVKIMTSRMFRDIDQGKWRKFIQYQSYSMQPGQPETGSWQEVGFPLELTGATAFSPSPDGQKLLVLREEGSDKKEWVMDVYDNHHLIHKWGLGSIHEKPCNDGWFGCVSWSSCGKYAVYVAERKAPKTKSWFAKDEKKPDKKKDEKKEDEEKRGEEFAWREDWGEKYVGTVDLGLFVVNLENGKVKEIKGAPDDLTIGSPVFSADAKHVVYTAWNNLPNKLGMIYCYQRPCKLYACNIEEILEEMNKADKEEPKEEEEETKKDGTGNEQDKKEDEKEKTPEHICLTPNARLSRTPRFSPDGTKLAYVTNPEGFATHGGAFQLSIMDWQGWNKAPGTSPESSVLVDIVANPGPDDFPGIWGDSVPSKCWAPDGSSIFLTSAWRSSVSVLKIDALSGQVTRMQEFGSILEGDETSGPLEKASSSLFEVGPYGALFAASCPSNPGGLGVAFAKEGDKFLENMHVTPAARNVSSLQFPHTATCKLTAEETAHLADKVKRVNWRVLEIQPDDGGPTFDAILWLPPESATKKWASEGEENALPPLIVTPHGGPHGLCSTSYIPAYAWQVAAQGYALLLVNYRGSIGFGKDALDSLPGNCGTQDVADVLAATKAAMELSPPVVNPERVAVVGGSHGGFLAGHMIGQHADVYKVGVMRNPVTNIASMVGVTDIRDWCFVEALGHQGYDFDTYQIPTSEDLAKMWAASPIAHAQKVKAPTLLCVGAMDRRVPCSQSVEYYNVLKSLGVKTKMLWYPEDVHAIDIVKSDADEWVNLMNWLNEHI